VTGGAGYIGSHVVHMLNDLGHDVTILDNFSLGCEENVDKRARVIRGDIRNAEDLEKSLDGGIDMVFHFAAWKAAGESMTDPGKYAVNNIGGTIGLLNAMLEHNVSNLVFSSTAAVYGNPEYLPVDEKHPLNPENYYGYSKLAIEQNLYWYSKLKNIRYAALRYFNATGYDIDKRIKGREQNPANLTPVVMEVANGERERMQVFGKDYDTRDGTCIRDYIHVNDLAEAHIMAMDYLCSEKKDLTVNLGTGSGHTVLEMIQMAQEVSHREIRYDLVDRRAGDPQELIASSERAREILGWQARHSDLKTIFESMMPVYFL
jgi:UDP-glucose 4-epimerase